jgi:hypothetical protein
MMKKEEYAPHTFTPISFKDGQTNFQFSYIFSEDGDPLYTNLSIDNRVSFSLDYSKLEFYKEIGLFLSGHENHYSNSEILISANRLKSHIDITRSNEKAAATYKVLLCSPKSFSLLGNAFLEFYYFTTLVVNGKMAQTFFSESL